ncbi:MAG TPA: integron integrase, partial [Syntrophobacteraceae bacterium]|nr:integron integrase [Syntrophobacteraceae bacterium]
WILRFIRFHGGQTHPNEMGKSEVEAFLSHLATHGQVSAATQKQAFNAILFLYRQVLDQALDGKIEAVRAKARLRIPVVMTRGEVKRVLTHMSGTHQLMAKLMYGGGLRLMECVRLRVQDLDLDRGLVCVRAAKGDKDRTTLLPVSVQDELRRHVERVKGLHQGDLAQGFGEVYLPIALARKYPQASREFRWQYVFPAKNLSIDPRAGITRRHHVLESGLQKAVKVAVERAELHKRVTCHTFRHCFATHLLENGVNIRMVQELMGHSDVRTTEIYTHVMEKDLRVVASPLDQLG